MPVTRKRGSELEKLIERAATKKERIILRRGRKHTAVVPIEDLKAIEMIEEKRDIKDARAALSEARQKGTISSEKVKALLRIK